MKCLINIVVVLFVFNFLKISNGFMLENFFEITEEISSEEDNKKIDYRELYETIPEKG